MNFGFLKFKDVALLVLLSLGLLLFNLNVHDYGDTTCMVGISGKTSECVLFHEGESGLAIGTNQVRFLIGTFSSSIFVLVSVLIFCLNVRPYSAVFSKFQERFLHWLSVVYRTGVA